MRFFTFGLCFCLVLALAAAFDFSSLLDRFRGNSSDDAARAAKFADIRSKLRGRKMKMRDVLNQTRGHWKELDDNDDLFDAAAEELNVNLNNNTDRSLKRRKFSRNLELAQNLTEKHKFGRGKGNATFGITPFSFMDFDEFKNNYLMKPKSTDELPIDGATTFGGTRSKRAVTSVDLRTKAVSAIRNQANCGSCWAFATASTMETSNFKKTGKLVDLSEQQFVNCDRGDNGCNGGWMSTAYNYAKVGIAAETTNAYRARLGTCTTASGTLVRVANYTQITPKNTASMKNALALGYSLAVAIRAGTPEFMSYTGGILSDVTDCTDNSVDHAVVIVGYGTENGVSYWIGRNSWGTGWGEKGYFRVKQGINYCNFEYYPFFVNTV